MSVNQVGTGADLIAPGGGQNYIFYRGTTRYALLLRKGGSFPSVNVQSSIWHSGDDGATWTEDNSANAVTSATSDSSAIFGANLTYSLCVYDSSLNTRIDPNDATAVTLVYVDAINQDSSGQLIEVNGPGSYFKCTYTLKLVDFGLVSLTYGTPYASVNIESLAPQGLWLGSFPDGKLLLKYTKVVYQGFSPFSRPLYRTYFRIWNGATWTGEQELDAREDSSILFTTIAVAGSGYAAGDTVLAAGGNYGSFEIVTVDGGGGVTSYIQGNGNAGDPHYTDYGTGGNSYSIAASVATSNITGVNPPGSGVNFAVNIVELGYPATFDGDGNVTGDSGNYGQYLTFDDFNNSYINWLEETVVNAGSSAVVTSSAAVSALTASGIDDAYGNVQTNLAKFIENEERILSRDTVTVYHGEALTVTPVWATETPAGVDFSYDNPQPPNFYDTSPLAIYFMSPVNDGLAWNVNRIQKSIGTWNSTPPFNSAGLSIRTVWDFALNPPPVGGGTLGDSYSFSQMVVNLNPWLGGWNITMAAVDGSGDLFVMDYLVPAVDNNVRHNAAFYARH